LNDVDGEEVDVLVSIGSRLFVEDTQRVEDLVNGFTRTCQTFGSFIIGRLQRKYLLSTSAADKRPTTARKPPI